ncbi:MAG: hypothetical protein AAB223_11735, partial [Pseudomonadota bacterium]
PGIPDGLEAVCLRALARDPGRRTRAASAFEADLRRWLRGEPVEARRPGAVPPGGGPTEYARLRPVPGLGEHSAAIRREFAP